MEFEIFKIGTHTSDKGVTKNYSEEDLNFIASSYNPQENEAPLVVGHPVDNSPAFGWVESLKVVGDKLIAKTKDIIPEFKEAVKKGLYKKRSISLDKEGKLRHIGFLGGAAPAVKGLADIQFSSEPVLTYDYVIANEVKQSQPNKEENNDDKNKPANSLDTPTNDVKYPEPSEKLISSFSDQLDNIQNMIKDLSQNFSEQSGEKIKDISTQLNDLKFKINTTEFEKKLSDKISQGSFTPAMKQKTMNLLEHLSTQNFSDEFDFNSYTEKTKNLLNEFIDSVPKIIYYENFAEKPEDNLNFKEDDYSGFTLDEESASIHRKALVTMKKDNISYEAAVLKCSKVPS